MPERRCGVQHGLDCLLTETCGHTVQRYHSLAHSLAHWTQTTRLDKRGRRQAATHQETVRSRVERERRRERGGWKGWRLSARDDSARENGMEARQQ